MNYTVKLTLVMIVLSLHRTNLEVLQDCAA